MVHDQIIELEVIGDAEYVEFSMMIFNISALAGMLL